MDQLVKMSNASKRIEDFQLGPLNLEIEKGFVTALVGSNGAGKSTLLKLMMNLVKLDNGLLTIFGEQIDDSEAWKSQVAYLPQTYPGPLPFTGMELKQLMAEWYPNWDEAFFQQIVDALHVPLNKKFETLSRGVQQKLKFALTLPRNPKLLILDEPTASVDIVAKELMTEWLVEWMEQADRTILFATHQVEDIRKLADYLVIIKDGGLLGKFEKDELTAHYKRYWIKGMLPTETLPGELSRSKSTFVTRCPAEADQFMQQHGITSTSEQALELEEIIATKLKYGKKNSE